MKKQLLIIAFIISICCQIKAKTDWKAQWISVEHSQSASNTWLIYHKTVELPEIKGKIYANIAVDSKYWLWINGKMVIFEGGLKRGPNPNDTYYDEIEISNFLHKGKNTLAVLVWHFGQNGFSHNNSGKAGLLFDCQSDNFTILSDRTWKCAVYGAYQNTEAPHPNYRLPESNIRFDARAELQGWTKADADPSLPAAMELGTAGCAPWNNLIKRPIPQWKDYGLKDYSSQEIRKGTEKDTIICQLPYNCQLTPYFEIESGEGKTIQMQTDNYTGGGAHNIRAEYITRNGEQQYESFGWISGHKVIYIMPSGIKVKSLKFRETGYNTEFTGTFTCNDPFMNKLREKALRTLYITMRDTYMDCPERERAQWWGDEVNELGEAFYALDTQSSKLTLKGIYELMGWQKENGVIFSPCPAGNYRTELPLQMLASVGYYGFYTYYLYSNDATFIPVIYDRLKKYLHEVWQTDEEGLAITRHGDWSWGDWGNNIDLDLLTNCWYYLALKAEKEFAEICNKSNDALLISEMMKKMEANFNSRFWTGKEYRSPNYTGETDDRGQAMAVLAGFATSKQYPQILKVLQKEYHASPYMEKYVGEALFYMGYPEFALQRTRERFADMVNHPYTTLWEGWGIASDGFGGGTINHAWSGGTLTLLSQYVAGIAPIQPGFREFTMCPAMGDLTSLSTAIDTPYGFIRADISRKGKKHHIKLEVPPGCTARIPTSKEIITLNEGVHELNVSIK